MSPLGGALVGAGAFLVLNARHRSVVAPVLAVSWVVPLLGVGGVGAALLVMWRNRLRDGRLSQEAGQAEVVQLAELLGLSLAAGVSLHAALEISRDHLSSGLRSEVDALLRSARQTGLSAALADTAGVGQGLYRMMARAVSTGAPLVPAVDGFIQERLGEEREERLADARRLPVKLVIPLALLILPGFVLLTLAPALSSTLDRLVFPF